MEIITLFNCKTTQEKSKKLLFELFAMNFFISTMIVDQETKSSDKIDLSKYAKEEDSPFPCDLSIDLCKRATAGIPEFRVTVKEDLMYNKSPVLCDSL